MSEELAVEGHRSPIKGGWLLKETEEEQGLSESGNNPTSNQTDNTADNKNNSPGKYSEGEKKEVFSIAEKILAAAAEKSGAETEKKLIAAVMAVHMKYAESLHVIENLIQDRKKIDDRVKFLEGQLKKRGKNKEKQQAKPPMYKPASSSPQTATGARTRSPSPVNKAKKASPNALVISENKPSSNAPSPTGSGPTGGDEEAPPDAPGVGDESSPEIEGGHSPLPARKTSHSPAPQGNESECEDELFVISENHATGEEGSLPPPAYNSKMKRKPMDPIRARKAEIKERLQELYDMPPATRGATPKSDMSVTEAFSTRPSTAPQQGARSDAGSDFDGRGGQSRRSSTVSLGMRRKKMSVKDEIESLEQEVYEIDQKLRFQRASKVGPSEFSGMKERDEVMRKRAEDRLEKSRQRAEAAEKLKKEEEKLQEEKKQARISRAKKTLRTDESGNPVVESWEDRLEREKNEREERKLKHKAALLAQRVPLTSSLEESINMFKDSKGKYAPEPPKIKIVPIKAADPEAVASRIAREAQKIEAAKIKKEKENEERIRNLAVAPDHPSVVKMAERATATKAKLDFKSQEQKRKEDELKAAKQREEQAKIDAIKSQKAPDVKPTNAQISRDLEVKRTEEARIEEKKRKDKAEQERIERQKKIQRNLKAAKEKGASSTQRVVLGEAGEPAQSGTSKTRPTLAERFDQYHKPHLHV